MRFKAIRGKLERSNVANRKQRSDLEAFHVKVNWKEEGGKDCDVCLALMRLDSRVDKELRRDMLCLLINYELGVITIFSGRVEFKEPYREEERERERGRRASSGIWNSQAKLSQSNKARLFMLTI